MSQTYPPRVRYEPGRTRALQTYRGTAGARKAAPQRREAHLSRPLFSSASLRPAATHIYTERLNFGNGVTLISEI